jgi:hypothetical protein
MKRQFFCSLSALIPAIALFSCVNGQVAGPGPKLKTMDFISAEVAGNPGARKNENTFLDDARKDFNKNFRNAEDVYWSATKNAISVQCKIDGMPVRIFYDCKGRWTATIRTYGQDKLPADVRKQVRSSYYDYTIYIVNEVTVGKATAYLVGIQDQDTIKTIRVIDGEMDVYEDFKKI